MNKLEHLEAASPMKKTNVFHFPKKKESHTWH
jgi:hypothetical protein